LLQRGEYFGKVGYLLDTIKALGYSISIALCLFGATSVMALSFGYKIQIQNELTTPAKIEISQYHSEKFGGERPKAFTENLRLNTKSFVVAAGKNLEIYYNDASGGFWLLWRIVEPENISPASGVMDLAERVRVIKIK